MPPLTRSRAGKGNPPQVSNALYYAQRASAGLIIAEATQVSSEAQGYISTLGIHAAEQVQSCNTTAVTSSHTKYDRLLRLPSGHSIRFDRYTGLLLHD